MTIVEDSIDIIEMIIRKVVIGTPKDGMTYQVGSIYGKNRIVDIYLDDAFFQKYSMVRFNIMVSKPDKPNEVLLWKNILQKDISVIEYFV